jgi:hypothetical protein
MELPPAPNSPLKGSSNSANRSSPLHPASALTGPGSSALAALRVLTVDPSAGPRPPTSNEEAAFHPEVYFTRPIDRPRSFRDDTHQTFPGPGDEFLKRQTAEWKFFESHKKRVEGRINDVRELAKKLRPELEGTDASEPGDLADLVDSLGPTCDYWEVQLSALVDELDPKAAIAMSLSLEAEIRVLEDIIEQYGEQHGELATAAGQHAPVAKGRPGRHHHQARRFLGLFRSIKHDLWSLISGLLTPQEWTLKGDVNVPWLAGAGIEIKFGPRRGEGE